VLIGRQGTVRLLTGADATDPSTEAAASRSRVALARHLVGAGIEIGPGHAPFPLAVAAASARYVDRWAPETSLALFPELEGARFRAPDILLDLDRDGLGPLESESEDFVVAAHVLEHVADPLRLLGEIQRVLRPQGNAVVLLPDRTRTFDAGRPPTPLSHLVAEHEAGVTNVSDEHIVEFVTLVEGRTEPPTPELIELHRRRSIHVHCWTEAEFAEVVEYATGSLGQRWLLVDGVHTDDPASVGSEFGLVLRKAAPGPPRQIWRPASATTGAAGWQHGHRCRSRRRPPRWSGEPTISPGGSRPSSPAPHGA
jgi:SAM-dependent methyltransferase